MQVNMINQELSFWAKSLEQLNKYPLCVSVGQLYGATLI